MSKTITKTTRWVDRTDARGGVAYIGIGGGGSGTAMDLSNYYTKTDLDDGQLDSLYYTETELDGGQLDNRYYTETELLTDGVLDTRYYTQGQLYTQTELDNGQLDNRYYTETELDGG